MAAHDDSVRLWRALQRCEALVGRWSGVAFRTTALRYANRDELLTGAGSMKSGARWNPPESFHAVYLSLVVETALDEYLGQYAHYGLEACAKTPLATVSVEVWLQRVLDLTSGAVRRTLGVSESRIVADDWAAAQDQGKESLTQALGRLGFEMELEGLLVPSAARRGETNLVIFPGNLLPPGSWLKIVNRDQLPPPPSRR